MKKELIKILLKEFFWYIVILILGTFSLLYSYKALDWQVEHNHGRYIEMPANTGEEEYRKGFPYRLLPGEKRQTK